MTKLLVLLLLHYMGHLFEQYPIFTLDLGVPIFFHLGLLEFFVEMKTLVRFLNIKLGLHIDDLLFMNLTFLLSPST